jgi:uncharacterized protein YjbI with pentapeptide repeats
MANPEHLTKLKQGVKAWNEWRETDFLLAPDLSGSELSGITMVGANLRCANLKNAKLCHANLSEADLVKADLTEANFDRTILNRALFAGSKLTKATLREAFIEKADFTQADLTGADLSGSRAIGSGFANANLRGARLKRTLLYETNLFQTHFICASLVEADIRWANFSLCHLDQTDFSRAICGWTTFGGVDLSASIGLEQMDHAGPSTVGVDTIARSAGTISEAFLRGAGVPEQFITYARSLVTNPIEFYSCFISYSSHDQAFAERLNADLRARNLRCWFAPEDLKIGDRFQERIEESIRLFDKVMIVLSENSIKSRWVEREVNAAREREDRENRTVLFPICIDDAVMDATQPWAADIRRSRHIGDFSRWKDRDSYRKGFERLLRDLEANEAKAQKA